mgnify:CR=1 FL=1
MVQTRPRDLVREEIAEIIRQAAKGREDIALEALGDLLDELVAGMPRTSTPSVCPVCGEGTLHYWKTREVLLQGLGDRFRPTQVLDTIRKIKNEGLLLGMVERRLGEIPTLKGVRVRVPLYICSNPKCDGLTLSILGGNDPVEAL